MINYFPDISDTFSEQGVQQPNRFARVVSTIYQDPVQAIFFNGSNSSVYGARLFGLLESLVQVRSWCSNLILVILEDALTLTLSSRPLPTCTYVRTCMRFYICDTTNNR
jgi:hypothetical protein